MMANILRSIPMLLVIGFNLLLAILFSLIYARNHHNIYWYVINFHIYYKFLLCFDLCN